MKTEKISMSSEELKLYEFIRIVGVQAHLHQWESLNFPLTKSLTGRYIYFYIVSNILSKSEFSKKPLKNLLGDCPFSEKGIRKKIQELEKKGFIKIVSDDDDARSKYLKPTDALYASVYVHAEQIRKVIEKDFLLIDKHKTR
jgi:predicted transcriptional regulator